MILGLDGASWNLIQEMNLPHLQRLCKEGARANLKSTTPPMTLPAWSSILTGCNPGKHGIIDFVHRIPKSYQLEFSNSTFRQVPTLHRLISDQGGRVASIVVPTTYPPEDLNGVVIAGFDSPIATKTESRHCNRPEVYADLEQRFGRLCFADIQETRKGPGWGAQALACLLREIERKEAICQYLLEKEHWDAFMVVFGESDTAAHHFWMFHDPQSPRYLGETPLKDALKKVYQRLDVMVGKLSGYGKICCICSDHGFGGAGRQVLYLNRFLESQGWLKFRPPSWQGGERLRQMALHLPIERLLRRMPSAILGRAETLARYGGLDLAQTRAWSDEMNYAATIHLNIKGRDPLGMIDDPKQATQELEKLLYAWRVDGQPVVARVIPRQAAFVGPVADRAPDLILELALPDNYSYTLLPSNRVPAQTLSRRLSPEEYMGGKGLGMNGTHRQHGILILQGPGVRAGAQGSAEVQDVLPTLFHLIHQAIPAHVDGRVLEDLVETPVTATRRAMPYTVPSQHRLGAKAAQHLQHRLEALGYLG